MLYSCEQLFILIFILSGRRQLILVNSPRPRLKMKLMIRKKRKGWGSMKTFPATGVISLFPFFFYRVHWAKVNLFIWNTWTSWILTRFGDLAVLVSILHCRKSDFKDMSIHIEFKASYLSIYLFTPIRKETVDPSQFSEAETEDETDEKEGMGLNENCFCNRCHFTLSILFLQGALSKSKGSTHFSVPTLKSQLLSP